MPPLRILIVDDSPIVRTVLANLITKSAGDWMVCGAAVDGDDAMRQAQESAPNLILLDLSLRSRSGMDVGRELCEAFPSVKIVIMSEHEPAMLSHVSKASGFECVPKSRLAFDLVPLLQRNLMD